MSSLQNNETLKKKVTETKEAPAASEKNAVGGSAKNDDAPNSRKRSPEEEKRDKIKSARSNETSIIDKAVELGFKEGDRLVVEWEIDTEEKSKRHDWGATLTKWNGKTRDGFAIRELDYDAFPPDFPERSLEEVVFVTEGLLLNAEDGTQLNFHREGEEPVVGFCEEDLNQMLANTLDKNSEMWKKLSAAQQAHLGDVISRGKEQLLQAIKNRWEANPGKAISSEEVPELMAKAFEGIM